MVFKCNERSSIEESFYLSQKHIGMDFGDQPHSFVGISQLSGIHEKPCASDEGGEVIDQAQGEEKPMAHSSIEYLVAAENNCGSSIDSAADNNQPASANDTISSLSGVKSGFDADIFRSEVSKRSHSGDELCQLAFKRSRPLNSCSCFQSDEAFPRGIGSKAPLASDGEDEENAGQFNGGESCSTSAKFVADASKDYYVKELTSIEKLNVESASGISGTLRDKQANHEAVAREFPFYMPYPPRFTEKDEPSIKSAVSDDTPLAFYDCFPRKHVALGPDHQVNVPLWGSRASRDFEEESSQKLMGTCILPMPNADVASSENVREGFHANDCCCSNQESIRCIRKHVAEAREMAKITLGPEKFSDLGLCDMGEDVSLRWSEEDEQVFHEVVFANPVSCGKNFWNVLPQVFPSRSTKDFVSYYFNVFMLRKREAQNRSDPWNVDSDNDEWQESDDGEFTMEDGEEHLAVASPMDHKDVVYANDHEEEEDDDDDDDDDGDDEDEDEDDFHGEHNDEGTCDDFTNASEVGGCGHLDIFEGYTSCKLTYPDGPLIERDSQNDVEGERDIQDDSCTSYEGQQNGADGCGGPTVPATAETRIVDALHKDLHEGCKVDSSGASDNTYMPGSCDPKAWDVSYFSRSAKVDFLPTCYVIEEVFGKGTWDADARDGHGIM